jgi:hypothetical protein
MGTTTSTLRAEIAETRRELLALRFGKGIECRHRELVQQLARLELQIKAAHCL